ncbi:helix-turn-helix domain-containing protein [Clostridium estertheticum]|uniref:helix-turn-helix domain-containing protein n=1 Tax=Clostridium estertheticum TaxID=238834 RepID=UPI001CF16C17|nr:helix-turn-helix domain-containing protein [Clostridium estertheticum]MCB2362275.1 helix-turn-helix domain-containing protein [Clostridium estertheticum]
MNIKNTKVNLEIELQKEWYTIKEAVDLTGISTDTWHYRIKKNIIKEYKIYDKKVDGNKYYIGKNEIRAELDLQEFCFNKAYVLNDAMEILNLSYLSIKTMIRHKEIVDYKFYDKKLYISKKDVEIHLSEKEIPNGFYTINEVMKITRMKKNVILGLIEKREITGIRKKINYGKHMILIPVHFVEDYISGKITFEIIDGNKKVKTIRNHTPNDSYTVKQASEILGLSTNALRILIREGEINAYKSHKVIAQYIISKDEIKNILNNIRIVKIITKNVSDWSKAFNMLTDAIKYNTSYKNTCDLYKEWALYKINISIIKDVNSLAIRYVGVLENLVEVLDKEIYLYSDDELIKLIHHDKVRTTSLRLIPTFLEYCKNKITTQYSNSYTNAIAKKKKTNSINYRYDIDDWVAFYKHLSNIDSHICNAIKDYDYAQAWLYSILHLSIAWRKMDIKKIPNVALELINIFSFEDIKNDNFTIYKAQLIINHIKERTIGITANKTGARIHFIVPLSLVLSTAIAFVICEIHRRESCKDTLLNRRNFNLTILFENTNLPKFMNIKANASLISYNFEYAVNKEGFSAIAYNLASLLRAHTTNSKTGYADTTTEYIYATNSDKSVENIPLHLFKRGFFGWQVNMLLGIIDGNNQRYTIEEKTDLICNINNELPPIIIESMAEFLNFKHEKSNELLQELILLPKDEIISKIKEIISGQSPALLDYSQCLKGIHKCVYTSKDSCFSCKYLIPTNYLLSLLKIEIYSFLDKLERIEVYKKFEIQKYSFMLKQLYFILMEAKLEYSRLDKNYINSFFNLNELKDRFIQLEQKDKIINY